MCFLRTFDQTRLLVSELLLTELLHHHCFGSQKYLKIQELLLTESGKETKTIGIPLIPHHSNGAWGQRENHQRLVIYFINHENCNTARYSHKPPNSKSLSNYQRYFPKINNTKKKNVVKSKGTTYFHSVLIIFLSTELLRRFREITSSKTILSAYQDTETESFLLCSRLNASHQCLNRPVLR